MVYTWFSSRWMGRWSIWNYNKFWNFWNWIIDS